MKHKIVKVANRNCPMYSIICNVSLGACWSKYNYIHSCCNGIKGTNPVVGRMFARTTPHVMQPGVAWCGKVWQGVARCGLAWDGHDVTRGSSKVWNTQKSRINGEGKE